MSIKFPDLQVLFPRAHDTSRTEQLNQRQGDLSQAQVAAEAGKETITRRRQVAGTERQTQGRIGEREAGSHRQSPEGNNQERQGLVDDDKNMVQGDLGQRIDIRI